MEIHTETPKEGVPRSEIFSSSTAKRMHDNLNRMGKDLGIHFNENERLSNSHIALAAGEYAKEKGKFRQYNEKLFYVYFTDGKDIGDMGFILDLAESLGMDKDELRDRLDNGYYDDNLEDVLEQAQTHGINSTPTFIIDNEYAIVGAQPIDAFRDSLIKIENMSTC